MGNFWGPPRFVRLLPWSCGGPSNLSGVAAGPCEDDPEPPHPPGRCLIRYDGEVCPFFLCVLGPHPPNCRLMSSAAVSLVWWMVMKMLLLAKVLLEVPLTAAEGRWVPFSFLLAVRLTWEVVAWIYGVVWSVVVEWFLAVLMKGWNEGALVVETIFAPGPAVF